MPISPTHHTDFIQNPVYAPVCQPQARDPSLGVNQGLLGVVVAALGYTTTGEIVLRFSSSHSADFFDVPFINFYKFHLY